MRDKLTIHGLDLGELGIGDVLRDPECLPLETVLDQFARQLLGSITFGPTPDVRVFEIDDSGDDEDWPLAE